MELRRIFRLAMLVIVLLTGTAVRAASLPSENTIGPLIPWYALPTVTTWVAQDGDNYQIYGSRGVAVGPHEVLMTAHGLAGNEDAANTQFTFGPTGYRDMAWAHPCGS